MITQDEWNKLKGNEAYGMYVALEKRIKNLEDNIPWISKLNDEFFNCTLCGCSHSTLRASNECTHSGRHE